MDDLRIFTGTVVERRSDVDTLLLDKTGTITHGNRRASEFVTMPGVEATDLREAAAQSSLADPTPEGTSIVALARKQGFADGEVGGAVVPFTAQTRMSGLDLPDGTNIRKGASSAVLAWLEEVNGEPLDTNASTELDTRVQAVSNSGGTPLVVAVRRPGGRGEILGIVHLKDIVKEGLTERFEARKDVDRAKGLLQKQLGIDETQAFRWLQKTAMDRRLSMREVARAVVEQMGRG